MSIIESIRTYFWLNGLETPSNDELMRLEVLVNEYGLKILWLIIEEKRRPEYWPLLDRLVYGHGFWF